MAHTQKELWFDPVQELSIHLHYDTVRKVWYERKILWSTEDREYVVQNSWEEWRTRKEYLTPYKNRWSPSKRIVSGTTDNVYIEKDPRIEERVFMEEDYVVMGSLSKKHWVKDLWAKLVKPK